MTSRSVSRVGAVLGVAALVVAGVVAGAGEVAAAKKPYSVTAALSVSTVKTSHVVKLRGTVKPNAHGSTVAVQVFSGGKWKSAGTAKLSSTSSYTFSFKAASTAKSLKYRAVKAASSTNAAGTSPSRTLTTYTWGRVKAWGSDQYGELGNGGAATPSETPVSVSGLTEVTQIGANPISTFALARRYDGSVWAWGQNDVYQLGRNTSGASGTKPVKVPGISKVKAVAATDGSSLALRTDGTVWAWGANDVGQLGRGTTSARSVTPAKVHGLTKVVAIAAGESTAYALRSDGTVWAWGYNGLGDLGIGTTTGFRTTPVKVKALPKIGKIAASGDNGYALDASGHVYAWGYNSDGELGNGTSGAPNPNAKRVPGLSGITYVDCAYDTVYAVTSGHAVKTWGYASNYALGNGDNMNNALSPITIVGLTGVRSVGGAYAAGFALLSNRTVKSWGETPSEGTSSLTDVPTPVTLTGLTNVTQVDGADLNGFAVIG